jgi:hypothetical protein
MTSIRSTGPEVIPASGGLPAGTGSLKAPSLAAQAISAGLCEGFPDGPLSDLLRYPDERQRSRQQVLDECETEAAELDPLDKAALGRAVQGLIEATRRYAKAMYQKSLAELAASTSDAPDVMHEIFGERSWKDQLDVALAPLAGVALSPTTVVDFIRAIESAARSVEAAQKAL